jgi:indolepyruvate ferredoxin oxidoreductase alpha subunit
MPHPLLAKKGGETHLLLGNEAIVRGALEARMAFFSCYPGTPSSEVPDTLYRLSPDGDYYFEYSTNEKVALEVGAGASLAGLPTLVAMKHVGVNVAADPLMTLTYIGAPGGLVLLSADDPGCHSSQNEQDNRYYCRLGGIPCFEPCSAQEAKDMTKAAFDVSRKHTQPVMLRTTTRVAHLRGPVVFGDAPGAQRGPRFEKNPAHYVTIPAVARMRHPRLLEKLEDIREVAENSPFNTMRGDGKIGVIASGLSRAYVADVAEEDAFKGKLKILDLGMTYPLPTKKIEKLLKSVDKVLVVEESEPIVEQAVRDLAQRLGLTFTIMGKDVLPRIGEFETSIVRNAMLAAIGEPAQTAEICEVPKDLPNRPPNLCAGCSHRSTYYTVRQVFGDDALYSSDIGCYTLGIVPPLSMADFLLCMGSSVSAGSGMATAQDRPVIGFIGDSTFFHSGITGLINAVHNNHDLLLVVLDNGTTAMTGHQPHPGVEQTLFGENACRVDIEAIVRGCGVCEVETVSPYNYKKTREVFERMKEKKGVRVVISREPCVLFARRTLHKGTKTTAYVAEQTPAVKECLETLACPAFYVEDGDIKINEYQCTGCMFCVQVCKDIKPRKRSA